MSYYERTQYCLSCDHHKKSCVCGQSIISNVEKQETKAIQLAKLVKEYYKRRSSPDYTYAKISEVMLPMKELANEMLAKPDELKCCGNSECSNCGHVFWEEEKD